MAPTSNVATTSGRESTSVIVSTSVGPPGDAAPTAPSTSSIPCLQLVAPRIVSSHSPHFPLTSSSSTLFMPTPGVIASIGKASPNVATGQLGQVYYRPSLPESTKHDVPHSSRSPHPETIFPGLVYPRAADPRVSPSDSSHVRPSFSVSSQLGHPHSDSHHLYQGTNVSKPLGYGVDSPHSAALHPSSSSSSHPNKGVLHPGSSQPITLHPGISHMIKSHAGDSYGHSSHAIDPSHTPTSSVVFAPSSPSVSAINNRVPARPTSHSPVAAHASSDQREKLHSQGPFTSERSSGHHLSHKPPYLSSYSGNVRGEAGSRSIMHDDPRRGIT